MNGFICPSMFPVKCGRIAFRPLGGEAVDRRDTPLGPVTVVAPQGLRQLAREAFRDLAFFLRASHLEQLAATLRNERATAADRYTARALLRNATVAAGGELPLCQDTGTAAILAAKGERVFTGADDVRALTRGVQDAYARENLRHSQILATDMFREKNSGTNLPAQIEIQAARGDQYHFLFMAKGGGSSNKTRLYQQDKTLLADERSLTEFLREKIAALGVSACPPYHLAVVIGGLSPEMNLKAVKLATTGYLDGLPTEPAGGGQAWRDPYWEAKVMEIAAATGLGMQFTGSCFALDARVVRLPRHAASLPVGIGVGCNAHRNMLGKITARGLFLEKLERHPERFEPDPSEEEAAASVAIDLERPMPEIVQALSACAAGTRVRLNGTLIVARDAAHARLKHLLDTGGALPAWFRDHPIYYAGPAKTPPGKASGSFGPTTALRMDRYVADFMRAGASRVMLAKGERGECVRQACRRYRGCYLATVGGAAALMAERHIVASEIVDFADLGMEAVRKLHVRDLPAFVVFDTRGRSLYP